MTPWPPVPFGITIPSTPARLIFFQINRFNAEHITIFDLAYVRNFFKAFGETLEREGDFVPRYAGDTTIDLRSYTRWKIDCRELPPGNRLPTTWAVGALDILDEQISAHGVPSKVVAFVTTEKMTLYSIIKLDVWAVAAMAKNVSSLGAVGGFLQSD